MTPASSNKLLPQTRLVAMGRNPSAHSGAVNTPVYRASTILYASADHWLQAQSDKKEGKRGVYYGRLGTPLSHGLEDAICEMEAGVRCFLYPSGLSAVYHTLAAFCRPASRVLISKYAYAPSRHAADHLRETIGADVHFFDPMDQAAFAGLLDERTSIVLLEAPGSNTFEVCDVDALAGAARSAGAMVAMDNTWATPLLFQPLMHGVDISIQALTKYISGNSDMLGGSATVNERALAAMKQHYDAAGCCLSADDCYSASRGLRTLDVRLRQHEANGLALAGWFKDRPEVQRVRHPALPENPGHPYWRDNFRGACGLFSVDFKDWEWGRMRDFLNALALFGIGASWGGFESLALPGGPVAGEIDADGVQVARVRFHAGLENVADLIADLESALEKGVA